MSEEIAPVVTETAPEVTKEATTTEATDWYSTFKSSLDESGLKSIEKYKDGDSFKNGIFSAFSMIGKKGDIPSADSAPEAKAEFAEKLGFKPLSEAKTFVELDAGRFGDSKAHLEEMYNGGINQVVSKAIENFRSNPSIGAFEDAITEWAKADAEATFESQIEGRKAMEKQLVDTASKYGLSKEQMVQLQEETAKRHGWNDETNMYDMFYALSKSETNSQTLQDAHLNNTHQGLDLQIEELAITLRDRSIPEAQHKMNLDKFNGLLAKKAEMLQKG